MEFIGPAGGGDSEGNRGREGSIYSERGRTI